MPGELTTIEQKMVKKIYNGKKLRSIYLIISACSMIAGIYFIIRAVRILYFGVETTMSYETVRYSFSLAIFLVVIAFTLYERAQELFVMSSILKKLIPSEEEKDKP